MHWLHKNGGVNLYGFVGNNSINQLDKLGPRKFFSVKFFKAFS
jgi:hypothetical protein